MPRKKRPHSSSGRRRSGSRPRRRSRRSSAKSGSRRRSGRSGRVGGRSLVKWKKLRHNGPLFPDPYKRLPRNVGLYYNGRLLRLSKEAEEAATLFAKTMHTKDTQKKRFQNNFLQDWRSVMKPAERKRIRDFRRCDFSGIQEYLIEKSQHRRKKKSSRSKTQQEKLKEKYGYCYVDGKKQPVGNYKIEPPGIFKGRGNNMLVGKIKPRIQPKDVIINISRGVKVPKPSVPGRWKAVVHDDQAMWLAAWKDPITKKMKYIYTSPASDINVENLVEKFEKARELTRYIADIRRTYMKEVGSPSAFLKQRGLALYFIDKLCLRIGNESPVDSSETIGCCSLQKRHLVLGRTRVHLKFSGKDSIAFDRTEDIPAKVYKALKDCTEGKSRNELVFDLLTPADINSYLVDFMPNLTSRVFRTHNASTLFEEELYAETDDRMSVEEKLLGLDKAYVAVAELCNHKKTMPKTHKKAVRRLKKKVQNLAEDIASVNDEIRQIRREGGKCKLLERKEKKLRTLEKRLLKQKVAIQRKELTKDYNLQTGKMNYIDPRITVAWGITFDVPVEKMYTKALREKFSWAIEDAVPDFVF